ncbi:MAG TPA: undecaprenyl-diphosphate phosphatase [Candidatus Limiplasma sp.]|nr:undecaprenyl-diphosphate phosphatase [Candidatus Limiplasma sp.]
MGILKASVLGLVQGLSEFLPISSSGHLNLFEMLLQVDLEHQLLFNILLHVGTLVAVLAVFWREWVHMIAHPIKDKTLLLLIVASLPALAAKVLLGDRLDALSTGNALLGVSFLFTGLLLVLTQWISQRQQKAEKEHQEVGVVHALIMGCLQAVGMLPGVSRSGSTIFGGVASGLDRKTAAKFSFMMSMPAILASFLSEGYDAYQAGALSQTIEWTAILAGMAVAAISGYLAIRFFLRIITKASLNWFALYVVLLGIAVIFMQGMGIIV